MLVDDYRFSVPLYTVREAAQILDVPPSTLWRWARWDAGPSPSCQETHEGVPVGVTRSARNRGPFHGLMESSSAPPALSGKLITHHPGLSKHAPSVPFIGLAEGMVLAAVRRSGVPMQRVRPALQKLSQDLGVEHALASRRLYTDGAELLFDYGLQDARSSASGPLPNALVVVRNSQRVFVEAVAHYLKRMEYASDGYARLIHLPTYGRAKVVADPARSFGVPIFERGGARVSDVLERFWAGEGLKELEHEFGVPYDQLEDAVRVASRRAA